ncbi:DUF262 domain-containing protein [Cellulomonas shaoxiangyii]|uniref:DUF262 domain-containing protein n=1 Tax=Cellulomonas shaoxiangyii TaxID=2566013 RepID=A0A4P7SKT8_9CELL|nr:DUF262 domain-containing protein [Cellulomonas shaoxiangyii]QCB94501.1 DUF262 domain-containing protein [Cellulomonas shaoxiangyii]TGY86083.1 DUF262 domain-containing protein [Cellulomonas shaoxiangyii]
MQFIPRDPDLETLVGRIRRGAIDLQPNFQRGEVWGRAKQQRLVDSVLRGWHIPPVHLVAREDGGYDVLDGQQRLTALRDFSLGKFAVDGHIEPLDSKMAMLHGLRYEELPPHVRGRYDTFSIRVLELHNFQPEEPHELFFRLNQPTSLTEAEKRNAFIGGARNQVKELVSWAVDAGMRPERLGFSNSRLAYDDIIARFLLTIEQSSLNEKITAQRVTYRYRGEDGFSEDIIGLARDSLSFFLSQSFLGAGVAHPKPNKATLHTWLCFAAGMSRWGDLGEIGGVASDAIEHIERSRSSRDFSSTIAMGAALAVFHDRSTARVADVSSVVLRDLIAWMVMVDLENERLHASHPASDLAAAAWARVDLREPERSLLAFAQEADWGHQGWI